MMKFIMILLVAGVLIVGIDACNKTPEQVQARNDALKAELYRII